MSTTPRTDAEEYNPLDSGWVVDATFARQLERELSAAHEEIARADYATRRAVERAERAEAERDALRLDAERYRWLRANDFNADDCLIDAINAACEKRRGAILTNAEKDAAIDAALKAKP
jgi:hypothetical protein